MSNSARKVSVGDVVTLRAPVADVYEEMGLFTVNIDGKTVAVRFGCDNITEVKPFDTNAIYRSSVGPVKL